MRQGFIANSSWEVFHSGANKEQVEQNQPANKKPYQETKLLEYLDLSDC